MLQSKTDRSVFFIGGTCMKREEKNALSRQRILDAAMEEFSRRGYEGASLNTVCAEKGLSKGIIYHYFSDKDDLYLLCVQTCFDDLTSYLRDTVRLLSGSVEERLQRYFDARLRFFTEHPLYLGIFTGAVCDPPPGLVPAIAERRRTFDDLNISVLTELLNSVPLREGLCVQTVAEDFRVYMDYFNLHFKAACAAGADSGDLLREHEERCHRQLNILLYGVFGEQHETT